MMIKNVDFIHEDIQAVETHQAFIEGISSNSYYLLIELIIDFKEKLLNIENIKLLKEQRYYNYNT